MGLQYLVETSTRHIFVTQLTNLGSPYMGWKFFSVTTSSKSARRKLTVCFAASLRWGRRKLITGDLARCDHDFLMLSCLHRLELWFLTFQQLETGEMQ